MTVIAHPQPGTIVRVDLNDGFRPPEMIKRRPCIILSPPLQDRKQLCAIVPLSTTPPARLHAHHLEIELDPPLPHPYGNRRMWVKADMVLTVAFHRLRLLHSRTEAGQRQYDVRILDAEIFAQVKACVRAGLGL